MGKFTLGVGQLRLDPAIEAEIRALRSGPPSPALRNLIARPDWLKLDPSFLTPPNPTIPRPPTARAPIVPRGRGPKTPRPGEVSDVLKAVWGIPAVQQATNRVLDQAADRAQRDWSRLSTGGRAAVVTQGAFIAGGALAGALSNPDSRQFLMGLIMNRDIPVPGVAGLELRITERGGQASYSNIAGSGVSARAGASADSLNRLQGEVHIMLDLARWVPVLK